MCLLVDFVTSILVSFCLLHNFLESVHSFPHSHVQSRLYEVEVVVKELSESYKEGDGLIKVGLGVVLKQSELDNSISELFRLKSRELLSERRWVVGVVIDNGWRLFDVLTRVHKFQEEDSG